MHIEPGLVSPEKIILSYATATGALGYLATIYWQEKIIRGSLSLLLRSLVATLLVFGFFEVLPHHAIGVSEVHLILGSTLFLIFGPAAAGVGLVFGLLTQGMLFAPFDLPQFGMNVTTLLVPLFAMSLLAKKVIPIQTAYVDLTFSQAFRLSVSYQGGIVVWVAFWALYGQGMGAENLQSIASFGLAYMSVILIEPFIDLGILALAKFAQTNKHALLVTRRLHNKV
ncbi:energy-coupling factor ABC transporter permease [Vibrio tapetis subsp. quintayensis]|uniref:energy-coupling factor ABC transporter permease n=1 Tax=Vibrio tapetis TaxID=52443 RepID=UPI0025B2AA65|nr:energy-coupling factor ABC transporter permease [Vibrio tapetis]MDN3680539.1 energy-coupling factor ABC transporter permease [Vibrio tapetis subsp. quintayensis]